jgi:polyhydroxyalkanoate synthesis regulator phasin
MRRKLVVATTAGVLTLSGLAVAVPALAGPAISGDASAAEERIREALSGLVEDGSLTEEQADEVAGTLAESGVGGRGGHHGAGVALDTAAEVLGLTEDELREALATEGATLADVAEEQGVDPGALVDALVQAAEERIAEAVEEGRVTQEEADERVGDLEERITELVQTDWPVRGDGAGRGPGRGHSAD